jgi:hypothetical protein
MFIERRLDLVGAWAGDEARKGSFSGTGLSCFAETELFLDVSFMFLWVVGAGVGTAASL